MNAKRQETFKTYTNLVFLWPAPPLNTQDKSDLSHSYAKFLHTHGVPLFSPSLFKKLPVLSNKPSSNSESEHVYTQNKPGNHGPTLRPAVTAPESVDHI